MSNSKRDPEKLIWDAETERDYPEDPGPDHAGQRAYETYLDRMGGSA